MYLPLTWDMTPRWGPLGHRGTKAAELGRPDCWSVMRSEKDLDLIGEKDKIMTETWTKVRGGLWEELAPLCPGESPPGRTPWLHQSSMVVATPPLAFLFPPMNYFLRLCTCGLSRLHVLVCSPFVFLSKSVWWRHTEWTFVSQWTLRSPALTTQSQMFTLSLYFLFPYPVQLSFLVFISC